MSIRTKRWDEPVGPDDGLRLLITRYRPRGVSAAQETWQGWMIALSPSKALHAAAYGKSAPPLPFEEYKRRFVDEMKTQSFWIDGLAKRVIAGETITLLCSSACVDESRCHRTLVKQLVEEAAVKLAPERIVRR